MISTVWTWLCSLDWLTIMVTVGVIGAVLCVIGAWLTLRKSVRASE